MPDENGKQAYEPPTITEIPPKEGASLELVRRVRLLAAHQPDVLELKEPWDLFQRDSKIVQGLDVSLADAQFALLEARRLGPLYEAPTSEVVAAVAPATPAPAPAQATATAPTPPAASELLAKAELLARTVRRASSVPDLDRAFVEALKAVATAEPVVAREAIKLAMRESWRSPAVDKAIDLLGDDQGKVGLALLAAMWNVGYTLGRQDATPRATQ